MTQAASLQHQVAANLRWNFVVSLIDSSFGVLAMSVVSQSTIMPLLVSELTPSRIAIGLIPAVSSLGSLLPQLLAASFAETMPRKKPFVMLLGGLGGRTPYLLIALLIGWLGRSAPVAELTAFLVLLAISAASYGTATPAWYDMMAKVMPVQRRGLWSGLGQSLGAFLGIAGAALAGRILATWVFPRNFGLCFILAFVSAAISWVGLSLTREPASPTTKPAVHLGHYLRQLPEVLRRDHNYLRFLVARSIANLGFMAAGFFMVYGKDSIAGALEQVGILTVILVATQAVMYLLWGMLGDRKGHKIVLCGAAVFMAVTALIGWLASSPAWLWITFAMLGISLSADSVSQMNIILEFCAPEDRPTYIGLTNTLLAPGRTLAPILGGLLATWFGYRGMFLVAAMLSVLGGVLLATWVREPRHVGPGQSAAVG